MYLGKMDTPSSLALTAGFSGVPVARQRKICQLLQQRQWQCLDPRDPRYHREIMGISWADQIRRDV